MHPPRKEMMELVSILFEHTGQYNRVRGVFKTPQEAEAALKRLRDLEKQRLGTAFPSDFLANFHISTFQVGVLDYP